LIPTAEVRINVSAQTGAEGKQRILPSSRAVCRLTQPLLAAGCCPLPTRPIRLYAFLPGGAADSLRVVAQPIRRLSQAVGFS
jgi:hypothetical protein